jgi:hypothetical protein
MHNFFNASPDEVKNVAQVVEKFPEKKAHLFS